MQKNQLYLAWTTCESEKDATHLAKGAIETCCAACAQVSSQIDSYYRWGGNIEYSKEYRILFKSTQNKLDALQKWVFENHPYDVPQWYAVKAEHVSDEYLDWVSQSL